MCEPAPVTTGERRRLNGHSASTEEGAQRLAISGYRHPLTCFAWDNAFANVIVADIGNLLPHLVSGSVLVSLVLSLPTVGPILLGAAKPAHIVTPSTTRDGRSRIVPTLATRRNSQPFVHGHEGDEADHDGYAKQQVLVGLDHDKLDLVVVIFAQKYLSGFPAHQ